MNKAITDGLALMPPPFAAGLSQWSSGNGTPGSETYAGAGGGVFVPADQDFGGCLELIKVNAIQQVRWMGDTPILPGLFLRVTARVKCLAGSLPSVRVAAFAATSADAAVPGVVAFGPAKAIASYGQVVEVSAIVATSNRAGVDMSWPLTVHHAHIGLDFTGPNGAMLRVDDLVVEDITGAFLRDMMAQVDVRDYGAKGNGTTNDAPAFAAADAAAAGREVLVPKGTYLLDGDVTFQNLVRFEGRVTMPGARRLILQRNFDLNAYFDAFGSEEVAFRKAFQALLNFADHEGLDLCGRRVTLTAPMDMQAADPSRTAFAQRRVIRNGQFQAADTAAWADTVATSQASYAVSSPTTLTNVANIANIAVGSLVTGNGVGREVYVRAVDVARQRLTLSAELFGAAGTQAYTFRRFKYLLDFSGFDELASMVIADVEFLCEGRASGVMLAPDGLTFAVRDCFFTRPKDRAITSAGLGCQGMLVDRCQFLSNEQALPVSDRRTVAFNANANDVKIRDNRVVMFKHFCVLGGTGSTIVGNHWFHGDSLEAGVRKGGIVLTTPNAMSLITGNYIDNNFIEWTNEHDATPNFVEQYSFGGLTVTGNIFVATTVARWFNWLVIKPYGTGHTINGLAVVGNVFRAIDGNIDRVEKVDTAFADLDFGRMRNISFVGNTFNGVDEEIRNPLSMTHAQATASRTWVCDPGTGLPFNGRARTVEAVVPVGHLRDDAGADVFEAPWVEVEHGTDRTQFRLGFKTAVRGTVRAVVRMDNPY